MAKTAPATGAGSGRKAAGGVKTSTGAKAAPAAKAGAAPKASLSAKVIGTLLALTGVLTVTYWILYFFAGAVQAETSAAYVAFENSFPAADGWMSLACFLGAAGLYLRRSWGLLFGLSAGSAMIFLGLMDVLYNLENAMYASMTGEMVVETVINVWTLGFGVFCLWFLWSRRRTYCA